MSKRYVYIDPQEVNFQQMVEESLTDFAEVDQSIATRTLNVYAYDCFDYAGNGNYFAYPDCIPGETI
jgi:hypothetical protein